METLVESIRITTSLFAVATAVVVLRALAGAPGDRPPILRALSAWLALAGTAGLVLTHVTRGLPSAALLPAGTLAGLALGLGALSSPAVRDRFAALEDRQWRLFLLLRAVFGALLLAAAASRLMPVAFALPAGLGDLFVAGLALVVPGSLAAGGDRGARIAVFGLGLVDFAAVLGGIVTIVVPWLEATGSPGISLLLPWVAVPLMVTLNVSGLSLAILERRRVAAPSA